jgi:hypothetical protein
MTTHKECHTKYTQIPSNQEAIWFIQQLIDLGGRNSSGEACAAVSFDLADGKVLRLGVTDDDVEDSHFLWIQVSA